MNTWSTIYAGTKQQDLLESATTDDIHTLLFESSNMIEWHFDDFQAASSGWTYEGVSNFKIHMTNYNPLHGVSERNWEFNFGLTLSKVLKFSLFKHRFRTGGMPLVEKCRNFRSRTTKLIRSLPPN